MTLILLFAFFHYAGVSQNIGTETDDIEALIDQWNSANNTRSLQNLERVYGDEVLFYTQNVTNRRALELKRRMFREEPEFRQRIVSYISYTPHSAGVTKCEFTKEVMGASGWKKYSAYLLIARQGNQYRIVGENDYAMDKALANNTGKGASRPVESAADIPGGSIPPSKTPRPPKVKPDLTEEPTANSTEVSDTVDAVDAPLEIASETEVIHEEATTMSDSALAVNSETEVSNEEIAAPDAATKPTTSGDNISILAPLSSLGLFNIPKEYVFILIGLMLVGGVMFLFTTSKPRSKRGAGTMLQREDEAELVVQQFKMQSEFEGFVITLFDPLYFHYKRPKAERVFAGHVSRAEAGPDLEFEFKHKETSARFAIKCLYYRGTAKREVQLFSYDHQQLFLDYEADRNMTVYFILGFGGTPDDPQELYLVPAQAVKSEFISKAALRPYSKSGMFFYNGAAARLQ